MVALVLLLVGAVAEVLCRISDRKHTKYSAVVWWEGERFEHSATSEQDALEWLACYPNAAMGRVDLTFHNKAKVVASRVGF